MTLLNVDLSTISAATDAAIGIGEPLQEIVDLNFQSGRDADLPSRLHLYNAVLHARHAVPIRSILVLLRPTADAPSLTGNLTYGQDDHRLEFRYRVIRLWQEPVETFLQAGLAVLPLAPLCRLPAGIPIEDSLRDVVVREINRRLTAEADHAEAVRLMTAAYILTGLRIKKGSLANIYKGIGMLQESAAYDEIMEEGEIRRSHRNLLLLGKERFGPADEAVKSELLAIRDLERLERLIQAILTAKSWRELLDTE